MIFEVVFDFFEMVLVWLSAAFPVTTINPLDSFSQVIGYMNDLNYFLPISEVFAITVAVFVIFPAFAGVSLLSWLIALIRGGSSRG